MIIATFQLYNPVMCMHHTWMSIFVGNCSKNLAHIKIPGYNNFTLTTGPDLFFSCVFYCFVNCSEISKVKFLAIRSILKAKLKPNTMKCSLDFKDQLTKS